MYSIVLLAVNDEGDDGNDQGVVNPFSFKNFLSDDLASRNKRVLQVIFKLCLANQ